MAAEKCNIVKAAFELQSLCGLEIKGTVKTTGYTIIALFLQQRKVYYGSNEILMFVIPPRNSLVCNYRAASQRVGGQDFPYLLRTWS